MSLFSLRDVVARATPLTELDDTEAALAVYRTFFEDARTRDPALFDRLSETLNQQRAMFSDPEIWLYRRSLDALIMAEGGHRQAETPFYLYYWDDRDGPFWRGWWVTPDEVGCTQYVAFARGHRVAPTECDGEWESAYPIPGVDPFRNGNPRQPYAQMAIFPSSDAADPPGALAIVGLRGTRGERAAGVYNVLADHPHHHGASRPVYKRARPLREGEERAIRRANLTLRQRWYEAVELALAYSRCKPALFSWLERAQARLDVYGPDGVARQRDRDEFEADFAT